METPIWFIVIIAVLLVLFLIRSVFKGALSSVFALFKGGKSGCGCLLETIIGILAASLLIWYILIELP